MPLVFEYYPFCFVDFKEQAYICKQPVQCTAEPVPKCGSEFFMDFGLYRHWRKTTNGLIKPWAALFNHMMGTVCTFLLWIANLEKYGHSSLPTKNPRWLYYAHS
jgi:hypothetical protein